MSTETTQLDEVRRRLLDLHKAVIDAERLAYEKIHGRQTPSSFLEHLLRDEALAWLQPWTALLVRMADALDASYDDEAVAAERSACVRAVRALIDVQAAPRANRYADLWEQSPDVLFAHGALHRALRVAAS